MNDEFEKQLADEEKLYSEKLSGQLTDALNSRAIKAEADELNGTSNGWPYPPTPKMLQLYNETMGKEWGKLKRNYDAFKVTLNVEAKKGKDPKVRAALKYNGDFKGGKSYMLKEGDTIVDIAKETYGHECYAKSIWEANEKVLGPRCSEVPAGWGIELPRIWVPEWIKEPDVSAPSGASSQAEKIKIPNLEFAISHSSSTTTQLILGDIIVEITVSITGEVKVSHAGGIDVTFDARKFSGSLTRAIGPLSGTYVIDMEKADASATISVINKQVNDVKFSGSLALGMGSLTANLGTSVVKRVEGDLTLEASLKAKAELKIKPNPKYMPQEKYAASVAAHAAVAIILAIAAAPVVAELEVGAGAAAVVRETFKKLAPAVGRAAMAH